MSPTVQPCAVEVPPRNKGGPGQAMFLLLNSGSFWVYLKQASFGWASLGGEGVERVGDSGFTLAALLPQLTINEAAAQFCMRDNTLLLRRVELFSLSRQVARESTYLSSLKGSR